MSQAKGISLKFIFLFEVKIWVFASKMAFGDFDLWPTI